VVKNENLKIQTMNRSTLTLLLLISCNLLNAQIDRDFWFAIPKETDAHLWCSLTSTNALSFRIATMGLPAQVTISMPANTYFTPVILNIPANTTTTYSLTPNAAPNYLGNWVAFDSVYANPANFDVKPANGITNHGIHITSTNDITVYYDYDSFWNRDLFSLKGKNALGTTFFTPFQNIWRNISTNTSSTGFNCYSTGAGSHGSTNKNIDAFSEFDVVATEKGTIIKVYNDNNVLLATVPLEVGQTYSYVAAGQTAAAHMTGYKIVSNYPVAVTINDDSVVVSGSSCADIIGDQLVPTDIIGTQYLVMTGDDGTTAAGGKQVPNRNEQVFVVATVNNTRIQFIDTAGIVLTDTTINSGKYTYISPDIRPINNGTQSSIYVQSLDPSKPIYVMHISGHGCETGGAIVPPINICSGSTEVNVVPGITGAANGSDTRITMNLMIPYDTLLAFNDPAQAHNHFVLYNSAYPSGFAIPGTWFEPNRNCHWAVLKMANRNWSAAGTEAKNIMVLNSTNRIVNTVDWFHLGMMNGNAGYTNKYGYFSSFSPIQPAVRIASTETQDYIGCSGLQPTLIASGGLTYLWHYGSPTGPSTYLSNPTSAGTDAIGLPVGDHNFYVEVSNPKCFSRDTLKVYVMILPKVTALFQTDKSFICAFDSVHFTNLSKNAQIYQWTRQIDNGIPVDLYPSNEYNFTESFANPTNQAISIRYYLRSSDNQGCNDTISKVITVFPEIYAGFIPEDTIGCNPFNLKFNSNRSSGLLGTYIWDFGDQGSSDMVNPEHVFENYTMHDTTYITQLVVNSDAPYFCTDTAIHKVTVHPYIHAEFTVDAVSGCGSFTVKVNNNSLGAITGYIWDFGDGTIRTDNKDTLIHKYPINTTANPLRYKLHLTVMNASPTGCPDTASRWITVFPRNTQQGIAKFNVDIVQGITPLSVQFNNMSVNISTFNWDFGDGTITSEINPSHEFTNDSTIPKAYAVKLTVQDYCGRIDSAFNTIMVLPNCRAIAHFEPDVTQGNSPLRVSFNNTSTNATTFNWNFGDNSTSIIKNPVHDFINSGDTAIEYIVKLVSANKYCSSDSLSNIIKVFPAFPDSSQEFTSTGIGSAKSVNGVRMFPNPAKDVVYLKYSLKKSETVLIELIDPSGKLIHRITKSQTLGENTTPISIEYYQGHLLFIKAIVDGETAVFKVIKE
jgi:PKD repeat protein